MSPSKKQSTSGNGRFDSELESRGQGGEIHQTSENGGDIMTTNQGVPIADDQNSLRAGTRGPTLMEDFIFREKMFHFDHERIPERVVHARGYGVHGYFENYEPLSDITRADPFQRAGQRTPVFVRFSTVVGSKGSPDLARDARGFAVKFYTQEGNWDLVSNNIPVFFIQDAIKFPDIVHSIKPEPDRDFPQASAAHDNFWDFISLTPESMNMIMWLMSDRAIPRSFRMMEGFAVHTFRLVSAEGKSTFVKFHWRPKLGMQSVLWDEAQKLNGFDPDYHRRDLWNAIEMGDYPEWELGLQLFDEEQADAFWFDILDPTKIIPEEEVPLRFVGRMVLDRRVDNFFAETEQVAFCTQHIIPGIDFTDDPLLQGRNFSYLDTQLKRLGSPNFTHLPINAPKCPFHNLQQDGHMAMMNPRGRVNYEPNSWDEDGTYVGPRESPTRGFHSYPAHVEGPKLRVRSETFADHYSQARQFYISQTETEQEHMISALTFELGKVKTPAIRERMVSHLRNIDETLAQRVQANLGIRNTPEKAKAAMPTRTDLPPSPALSILLNQPKTLHGRMIGVLVSDGVDGALIADLRSTLKDEGAQLKIVSPKVGGVETQSGEWLEGDEGLIGAPSVLFDAVAIVPSQSGAQMLAQEADARDFVSDAFDHMKYIAWTQDSMPLLQSAGVADRMDSGFVQLRGPDDVASFVEAAKKLRMWERTGVKVKQM